MYALTFLDWGLNFFIEIVGPNLRGATLKDEVSIHHTTIDQQNRALEAATVTLGLLHVSAASGVS